MTYIWREISNCIELPVAWSCENSSISDRRENFIGVLIGLLLKVFTCFLQVSGLYSLSREYQSNDRLCCI